MPESLIIDDNISIDSGLLDERFVLASGPGGQNVNKVSTAVQLRFDAGRCSAFSDSVFYRLKKLAGRRMTGEGILIIEASQFRSRERNREDARTRLAALVVEALAPPPPPRRKTRPTRSAVERRLKKKVRRGAIKRLRGNRLED